MKPAPILTLVLFIVAVFMTSGCDNTDNTDSSWYVSVNANTSSRTVYASNTAGLNALIVVNNTSIRILSQSWSVVAAPGGYALYDYGDQAELSVYAVGDYVVRYTVTYVTAEGYVQTQYADTVVRGIPAIAG